MSSTTVAVRLPDTWRILPVSHAGTEQLAAALRTSGAADTASALSDMAAAARNADAKLCAVGVLPAGTGRPPFPSAVVLAVCPPDTEIALDDVARQLGSDRLDIRILRLVGPAACLAWTREVSQESGEWRAEIVQYWVAFPEDGRTAVLTVVVLLPDGVPLPAEAVADLGNTLAFVDSHGRMVIPRL